ncbi:MAG: RlmE family RNA methyltransferase [Spirochaetales bacterium]|nr:RlmE family RNA methyltransferase [Spirochaetales bacterium]
MKRKPDHYSLMARDEGYQARSIFKLKEIQEKYKVIKPFDRVLDVGASPGSWSKYVLELYKGKNEVVGVDLNEVKMDSKYNDKYTFIQGDVFDEETQANLETRSPFQVILSDAAPSTSGDVGTDSYRSYEICLQVIQLAKKFLKKNGNLVIKIFQGSDAIEILKEMRQLFDQAKGFKPKASKNASKETYYLGFRYKNS